MIDTHTHLQFQAFDPSTSLRTGEVDHVIKEAKEAGVEKMVVVGTDVETSKKALDLAQKYDSLYAAVGIHPHHVFEYTQNVILVSETPPGSSKAHDSGRSGFARMTSDLEEIEKLLSQPKVIAIGEVGIDRHIYKNTKYSKYQITNKFIELQKQALIAQIKLTLKYQKTLIIHNREATEDLLELLAHLHTGSVSNLKAVFHCCESDLRLLDFAKKHHIYIGIDGDVTFDKAKQEFVKKIPLDLLVLETDSPFLLPKGFNFPNTPKNLLLINNFIAELINKDPDSLKKIVTENSYQLFSFLFA